MDGVKQGFGQFWWTSGQHAGDKYVGQFQADRRHGYGQYSFANGNVYDGNWVAGLQQVRGAEMRPLCPVLSVISAVC